MVVNKYTEGVDLILGEVLLEVFEEVTQEVHAFFADPDIVYGSIQWVI